MQAGKSEKNCEITQKVLENSQVWGICRICAGAKMCTFSLTDHILAGLRLADIVEKVLPIIVDEDAGLPLGVCSTCYLFITKIYKLHNTIDDNEEMFRMKLELSKSLKSDASQQDMSSSSTDHKKKFKKFRIKKFKCIAKSCEKLKFSNETFGRIHYLIDHTDILSEKSQKSDLFEVKVRTNDARSDGDEDTLNKVFGQLLVRKPRQDKKVDIYPDQLHCVLCYYNEGVMTKFSKKSPKFPLMKHVKDIHLSALQDNED